MKILHMESPQGFEYKEEVLPVGCKEVMHWHNSIEIIYVEKGQIRLAIRKRTYDVLTGEFAIINSCDHHRCKDGYKSSEDYKTVIKRFSFPAYYINTVSKLNRNRSFIISNDDIERNGIRKFVDGAVNGIKSESESQSLYSEALINSYVIGLFLNLQKTYVEKEDLGTTINVEYENLFNNFKYNYENDAVSERTMNKFQLILDYLDNNFSDAGLSLTTLAEISSLSECYISELFSLIVGIKFKQYLNTLRINYALKLLSMSDITISNAAFESGFETIRTFNSAFKRLKGVTPTEYLESVSGENKKGVLPTEVKNLKAGDQMQAISYFSQNCEIKITNDPENRRGEVFEIATELKNKVWTSFNINMLFKKGQRYFVSYDVYFLNDACGNFCPRNIVGANLFYAEADSDAAAHCNGGAYGTTGEGWVHYSDEVTVSENYIPGLYDKFSVFGNPINDVGVSFLLDNICCYPIY